VRDYSVDTAHSRAASPTPVRVVDNPRISNCRMGSGFPVAAFVLTISAPSP